MFVFIMFIFTILTFGMTKVIDLFSNSMGEKDVIQWNKKSCYNTKSEIKCLFSLLNKNKINESENNKNIYEMSSDIRTKKMEPKMGKKYE